jgi:hypothetical protein
LIRQSCSAGAYGLWQWPLPLSCLGIQRSVAEDPFATTESHHCWRVMAIIARCRAEANDCARHVNTCMMLCSWNMRHEKRDARQTTVIALASRSGRSDWVNFGKDRLRKVPGCLSFRLETSTLFDSERLSTRSANKYSYRVYLYFCLLITNQRWRHRCQVQDLNDDFPCWGIRVVSSFLDLTHNTTVAAPAPWFLRTERTCKPGALQSLLCLCEGQDPPRPSSSLSPPVAHTLVTLSAHIPEEFTGYSITTTPRMSLRLTPAQ